jgi:hypothetical protein
MIITGDQGYKPFIAAEMAAMQHAMTDAVTAFAVLRAKLGI